MSSSRVGVARQPFCTGAEQPAEKVLFVLAMDLQGLKPD
jgi:hypothetical protein